MGQDRYYLWPPETPIIRAAGSQMVLFQSNIEIQPL